MLKIKSKLNYRRGYTHKSCGDCDHFRPQQPLTGIGGAALGHEPRCAVIGLESGRMYRVNRNSICDRYDNTISLQRVKGLL